MILTNELKGIIAKRGLSQRKVARHLGMTEKTFYLKMKKGVFDSDEICEMINLLEIANPKEIFFCKPSHLLSDRKELKQIPNGSKE